MTNPAVIRRDLACWRELLHSPAIGPATRKALKDLISETESRLADIERQSYATSAKLAANHRP